MLIILVQLMISVAWGVPLAFDLDPYVGRHALETLDDGTVNYVKILNQDRNKNSGPQTIAVSRQYYAEIDRVFPNLRLSHYGANREQITLPVNHLNLDLEGKDRQIQSGTLVLGNDNLLYLVQEVYPDNRMAVYRLEIRPNHRDRVRGLFLPLIQQGILVKSLDEIRAVEDTSYGNYEKGKIYGEISGIPLCHNSNVKDEWNLPDDFSFGCNKGKQTQIREIFSDGSLLVGNTVFNPFQKTIEYPQGVEDVPESSP